jgi:acetyl-CoA acetyltransferase
MREVAIIGVGSTVFGKFPDKLPYELGAEAVWAAVQDAGITPKIYSLPIVLISTEEWLLVRQCWER